MSPKKRKGSSHLQQYKDDQLEKVVFVDVGIASFSPTKKVENIGRLVFELSATTHPRTVENFIAFCTGTQLPADKKNKDPKIHCYLGTVFSRVTEDGVQCGDVHNNVLNLNDFECNLSEQSAATLQLLSTQTITPRRISNILSSTSSAKPTAVQRNLCIFGQTFDDENIGTIPFTYGTLAMCNSGPNTNGCEFFISTIRNHPDDHDKTTEMTRHLSENYVAFGTLKEGKPVLENIYSQLLSLSNGDEGIIPTQEENPSKQLVIVGCGLMQ